MTGWYANERVRRVTCVRTPCYLASFVHIVRSNVDEFVMVVFVMVILFVLRDQLNWDGKHSEQGQGAIMRVHVLEFIFFSRYASGVLTPPLVARAETSFPV